MPTAPFSTIPEILADLRAGKMIVLTDDESRENEGDLILPAQFTTPEAITFMLREAKGYLCLSLTEADCDRLDLRPQSPVNTTPRGTAFTISIDGHPNHGFTTGVSAPERARCIRMAIDPATGPSDFARPGHINPLRSRDGGVLVRTGQTEGSIDLCRLAGLHPSAVIIEIMRDDGEMARVPDLEKFCAQHRLKMCAVNQIIEHRLARESLVSRLGGSAEVATEAGVFRRHIYRSVVDPLPHIALTMGDQGADGPALVRVHRRDLMGDIFAALAEEGPSSGSVLRSAMAMIAAEGRGAVVYLRHAGTDGLEGVLHPAAGAGDEGPRFFPGSRDYGIGSQILRDLGVRRMRLITNSDADYPLLEAFGLEIVERVRIDGGGGPVRPPKTA